MSYRGWRTCAWTPFGREVCVSVLSRYMRRDHDRGLLDEWLLCMNTDDPGDLALARRLADEHDWITLLEIPGLPASPGKIGQFYAFLTDQETVYLRFDDDIVYVHQDAVRRMCEAVTSGDEAVLAAFPVIINNAVVSWCLQQDGKIPRDHGIIQARNCLDHTGTYDPQFAQWLHEYALDRLEDDTAESLFLDGPVTLGAGERFSVNAFALTGKQLAVTGGPPGGNDEEVWMTTVFPGIAGKRNMIVNDALVAHFSFHPTWPHLLSTPVMSRYGRLAGQLCPVS